MLYEGARFAGFVIERRLGGGAGVAIYQARHPRLPRRVVLKVLHPDPFAADTYAEFEQRIGTVARLDQPSIAAIYDCGEHDHQRWLAMQLVPGNHAGHLIGRQLPAATAIHIIAHIARALDYAHHHQVVHREVRPSTIMLRYNAIGLCGATLVGFGLVPDAPQGHPTTNTRIDHLRYMSPEHIAGDTPDRRSDQYSLACCLFQLLTGTAPFDLHFTRTAQGRPLWLATRTPGWSVLAPLMAAVLDRGLAALPSHRFDSCADLTTAATRALRATASRATRGSGTTVQRTPYSLPPSRQRSRAALTLVVRRGTVTVLAVAVLTLGAVLGALIVHGTVSIPATLALDVVAAAHPDHAPVTSVSPSRSAVPTRPPPPAEGNEAPDGLGSTHPPHRLSPNADTNTLPPDDPRRRWPRPGTAHGPRPLEHSLTDSDDRGVATSAPPGLTSRNSSGGGARQ